MKKVLFFAFAIFAIATVQAQAGSLTLNCPGGLQSQPTITFGGSGIPNDAVCFGTFGDIDLALTATERYVNPPVTDDGTNTYFANTGDDTANGQPAYGVWNFDWYAFNSSATTTYNVDLLWDTDPNFGTDLSLFGHLLMSLAPGATLQNSWNLGMGFVDTGVPIPGIYSPASGAFSPYVAGNYGFGLNAWNGQQQVGSIGMQVNAGNPAPVPEPATMTMLGAGLVGLAHRVRRARRKHAAA